MTWEMETQQHTGEGQEAPKEREKAFLRANARSRGFLPTWALPIGRAATDVPQMPGANCGGGGAALEVGAARALPRLDQSPRSALGPPTRPSNRAPLRHDSAPGGRAARGKGIT